MTPTLLFEPSDVPLEVRRWSPQSAAMGPHAHAFYELLFVESGQGTHLHQGQAYPVRAGQVLLMAPGDVHDARGLSKVDGWLVLFEPVILDGGSVPVELQVASFSRFGHAPLSLDVPAASRQRLTTRLSWLADELSVRATSWQASARAQLSTVLLDLARWVAPLGVRQRPLVTQVFAVIHQRFHRPITLVDVAKSVGKSPAYLTDVVRRATGAPVGHWLLERRMAEARRLLLSTELSIAEVAERVGLDEPSYFVRRFKALHHDTPAAWRRRQRLGEETEKKYQKP